MRLPSSLRVRLVLWTVALEAVLLMVFAGILVLVLQKTRSQQIDDTLLLSASQLNAVVDVHGTNYVTSAQEIADLRTRGVLAWVLTPEGQVGATIGNASSYPLPTSLPGPEELADGSLANGEPVRLLVTFLREGNRHLGTLVLALSLRESQAFIRQIWLSLVIAVPIVLVLSAAGGLFLANRALSPVTIITDTAQQISAADLSQRLPLDLPKDEIGRLARTFDAMLDRLDRAFQRERQLTSDVSHELRTPLGMLKTQLSLARSRPRDAATLLKMMADMEGDVDRMTRLIEQLLTLARVEQRGLIDFQPVALDELLPSVLEPLQMQASACNVTLSLNLPPQVNWYLQADAERLRQVFVNLIENAIKYSSAGGVVTVSAQRHWQEVVVVIADAGPGIASEHIPHLFERFYRVDNSRARDTGGFGLGLAITQAIVQRHQGRIQVESKVGEGTIFRVYLPAEQHSE